MLFWVEQAFVGREEIRTPLKSPAREARMDKASISQGSQVTWQLQILVLERLVSCSVLSRIVHIVVMIPGILTAPFVMIHN